MQVLKATLGNFLMSSKVYIQSLDDLLKLERGPTAKRLILSLLSQPHMATLSLRQLIAWGELLGQTPAAIRVTAGRLVNEGLLETVGRGVYTIAPKGLALKNKASEWITVIDQLRYWKGGWLCIHTAHLSKTNRGDLRKRQRALRLLGFKEFVDGIWIRPDNLKFNASQMFSKLCILGLDSNALLLRSDVIKHGQARSPLELWDGNALNASYERGVALLQSSEQKLKGEDLRTVTRETFLVGEHIIRQINTDPLLPPDCVDTLKRKKLIQSMKQYSKFCHFKWSQFLALSA